MVIHQKVQLMMRFIEKGIAWRLDMTGCHIAAGYINFRKVENLRNSTAQDVVFDRRHRFNNVFGEGFERLLKPDIRSFKD